MMHLFFNESKRLLNLGKYSVLGYEKVSKENVKCQKIYNKKNDRSHHHLAHTPRGSTRHEHQQKSVIF